MDSFWRTRRHPRCRRGPRRAGRSSPVHVRSRRTARPAVADDDCSSAAAVWWPRRIFDVGPRLLELVRAFDVDARRRHGRDSPLGTLRGWIPRTEGARLDAFRSYRRARRPPRRGVRRTGICRRRPPCLDRSCAGVETAVGMARPQPGKSHSPAAARQRGVAPPLAADHATKFFVRSQTCDICCVVAWPVCVFRAHQQATLRGMMRSALAFALLGSVLVVPVAIAQQPPAPFVPKQSDRPSPVDGDEPGFQPIFDGKTLTGWEGDTKYWRAENGVLIGEITPDTVIKSNTFN